ncbi:uncharacterized protein LOC128963490 isoform X2 [Oppia nitens]|uniref:uncharacterized protein LOC128963490 isoform X2 n=1 Tax=Oppia nitens TaxID=1686743 RepID=UPI0023DC36BC|nr:uncharacterized protein LOC128963490 isoform X2 [Oppia nitens]
MFLTISQLLSISILVLFVGFISAQVVDSQESDKNRDDALQDINNRRHSIKYVMNVLNRLDHNLENMDKSSESETVKRGVDCSPIGGLPGADCMWNEMGEEAKAQKLMRSGIRNPGRKRRSIIF